MQPCPECNSEQVYRYKQPIESGGGYGPDLLPKLSSRIFSTAKVLPVICADCGYLRLYATEEARDKLKTSDHWVKI